MDTIISLITNYYYVFIIITCVLLISLLGIYVDNRREKADEIGEKIDEQLIKNAEEEALRKKQENQI